MSRTLSVLQVGDRWYVPGSSARGHDSFAVNDFSAVPKIGDAEVIVGLDSADCFFVSLADREDLKVDNRTSRQLLAFELEQHLPLDAEQIAADYQSGSDITAIAVGAKQVEPIIKQFDIQKGNVNKIVPSIFWLLDGYITQTNNDSFRLVWDHQHTSEVCDVINGQIVHWKVFHDQDHGARTNAVNLDSQLHPSDLPHARVVGPDMDQEHAVDSGEQQQFDFESLIAHGDLAKTKQNQFGKFNLRRGPLGPKDRWSSLGKAPRMFAIAASWLIVVTAVAAVWRMQRIKNASEAIRSEQAAAYTRAFPTQRPTSSPVRFVRSRYAQAIGARRGANENAGGDAVLDDLGSASATLHHALAALPKIRFRVDRIDVSGKDLVLDLRVKTAADAYKIAAALDQAGFDVEPPATDQTSDGFFSTRIVGSWDGDEIES